MPVRPLTRPWHVGWVNTSERSLDDADIRYGGDDCCSSHTLDALIVNSSSSGSLTVTNSNLRFLGYHALVVEAPCEDSLDNRTVHQSSTAKRSRRY